MKSLVDYINESRIKMWWEEVKLRNDEPLIPELKMAEFRILRKIFNLLKLKVTSTGKLGKYPFYFDGNDCVSMTDDSTICGRCFVPKKDDPLTIEGLAEILKTYIEKHKSELEDAGFKFEQKPELDKNDINRLRAISKETYDNISGIFPNLEIGAKGGVSAKYDINKKKYNITFSEKDGILTIRYDVDGGTTSRLAFGKNYQEVIQKTLEKLKNWGLDLTK